MATVMKPEASTTGLRAVQGTALPSRRTTTLYDVIAALQGGVGPEDDVQVVVTVVYLLRSGQLTWRRPAYGRRGVG